jgi:hypothetical protein
MQNRTQESVNVLLISLSEIVPVSKIDVYKEVVSLLGGLSKEIEALKQEQTALQKQLKDKKGAK